METWVWFTACLFIGYFSSATCNVFPVKISQAVGNISKLCPRTSQPFKDSIASTISDAITNIVNPKLNVDYGPVCGCGGKDWTKVADLNMTNTSQQCPTNWNLCSSNGTRGCGQQSSTNTCDSVLFPVHQNIPECVERSRPIEEVTQMAFSIPSEVLAVLSNPTSMEFL